MGWSIRRCCSTAWSWRFCWAEWKEVEMNLVLTYSKGKDREGMLMALSGLEGVREASN